MGREQISHAQENITLILGMGWGPKAELGQCLTFEFWAVIQNSIWGLPSKHGKGKAVLKPTIYFMYMVEGW